MAVKKTVKSEESAKQTCFVIMPFSDPESYEKGHFRKIYDHTFAPAIEAAGYVPLRIDDNSVSNLIHSKMMNELVTAPMVLCDLSTNNPNVLYELGIRHAFDLPVVLVQEIGQKRIFDIGGITSVEYHPSRLYEDVLEDQKKITEAIRQTANAKNKYSIMSLVALHAASPKSTDTVTQEDRLEYILQDMSRKMSTLEKKLADTQNDINSSRAVDNPNSSRKEKLISLWKLMADIEDYLHNCEIIESSPTYEEIQRYGSKLWKKIRECQQAGANEVDLESAKRLEERVYTIFRKLESEKHDAKSAAAI